MVLWEVEEEKTKWKQQYKNNVLNPCIQIYVIFTSAEEPKYHTLNFKRQIVHVQHVENREQCFWITCIACDSLCLEWYKYKQSFHMYKTRCVTNNDDFETLNRKREIRRRRRIDKSTAQSHKHMQENKMLRLCKRIIHKWNEIEQRHTHNIISHQRKVDGMAVTHRKALG